MCTRNFFPKSFVCLSFTVGRGYSVVRCRSSHSLPNMRSRTIIIHHPFAFTWKSQKNCGRFCVSCVSLWNPPFKYGSFMYERANELDDNRSGPSRYVCFHLSTDLLISYVSLTSLKILLDRVSKAWMAVDVSMCVGLIGLSGKLVVCERETCVSSARGSCVRKHVGERARSTNLSSVSSFTLPTLLKTKKLCPRHSMLSCSRRGRTR